MKILVFILTFFIFLTSSQTVQASDYSSSRCDIMDENESVFEKFPLIGGKFKKLQVNCCKNAIKLACDNKAIFDGCKGTLNALKEECSDDCELFVKDCEDYISTKDINSAYFAE